MWGYPKSIFLHCTWCSWAKWWISVLLVIESSSKYHKWISELCWRFEITRWQNDESISLSLVVIANIRFLLSTPRGISVNWRPRGKEGTWIPPAKYMGSILISKGSHPNICWKNCQTVLLKPVHASKFVWLHPQSLKETPFLHPKSNCFLAKVTVVLSCSSQVKPPFSLIQSPFFLPSG